MSDRPLSDTSFTTAPTSPLSPTPFPLPSSFLDSTCDARKIDHMMLWLLAFDSHIKEKYAQIDETISEVERLIDLDVCIINLLLDQS